MAADRKPVLLVGSSTQALIVLDILEKIGTYDVVGVTTEDREVQDFCGIPVLGGNDDLPRLYDEGLRTAALGVGGWIDNGPRIRVYRRLKDLGFEVVSAIHPSTIVGRQVEIGEAVTIYASVALDPQSSLGCNTIVGTNSFIGHETKVGDHVLISGGVMVGGRVTIGDEAVLSIGCTIVSGVNVGAGALVAAGAAVVKDVEPHTAVAGVPARFWREHRRAAKEA
jgi:sugar O-acyltransferase (sialic acid O-acetyltransferase NeuD family)